MKLSDLIELGRKAHPNFEEVHDHFFLGNGACALGFACLFKEPTTAQHAVFISSEQHQAVADILDIPLSLVIEVSEYFDFNRDAEGYPTVAETVQWLRRRGL